MLCFLICSAILAAALYAFTKIDASILLAIYDKYYPNRKRLANSTVWIVGSSTGIGEALAYEFTQLYCKIILTSTNKSKLEEVKKKCLKFNPCLKDDDILVLPFDISDLKANRDALKTVLDKFGDIDILVGNAARMATENSLEGVDDELETAKKIFDINYFANIYLAKMVVSHWEKTNSSGLKILAVTSSTVTLMPVMPFYQSYAASKLALNNFYRDLKLQYPKIQVSNCMPGPVETKITDNSIGKIKVRVNDFDRMSSKRCAELFIVGIANRLNEFIACPQWYLAIMYASIYLNSEFYFLMRLFNAGKYIKNQVEKNTIKS